jgi:hypothetical protein
MEWEFNQQREITIAGTLSNVTNLMTSLAHLLTLMNSSRRSYVIKEQFTSLRDTTVKHFSSITHTRGVDGKI